VPLVALGAFFVPMGLGAACTLLLRPEFAGTGVAHDGRSFVLFMGAATFITALPVLASIVRERNLAGTTAGDIATAAAGIMDVLAWLVLAAALIGTGHAGPFPLPVTAALLGCFVLHRACADGAGHDARDRALAVGDQAGPRAAASERPIRQVTRRRSTPCPMYRPTESGCRTSALAEVSRCS
jgi:hypothetical protein